MLEVLVFIMEMKIRKHYLVLLLIRIINIFYPCVNAIIQYNFEQ